MTRPIRLPVTQALGKHVLLELYQCPAGLLKNGEQLEDFLTTAAGRMGATVVTSSFHQFSPYGISGVVIIQESHLTLHTWPEHAYAAVDIFTCGDIDLEAGIEYLVRVFEARHADWKLHERGTGL